MRIERDFGLCGFVSGDESTATFVVPEMALSRERLVPPYTDGSPDVRLTSSFSAGLDVAISQPSLYGNIISG